MQKVISVNNTNQGMYVEAEYTNFFFQSRRRNTSYTVDGIQKVSLPVSAVFRGGSRGRKGCGSGDLQCQATLANITLYEMKLGIRHNGSEIFRAARAQIIETPNFMAKL